VACAKASTKLEDGEVRYLRRVRRWVQKLGEGGTLGGADGVGVVKPAVMADEAAEEGAAKDAVKEAAKNITKDVTKDAESGGKKSVKKGFDKCAVETPRPIFFFCG